MRICRCAQEVGVETTLFRYAGFFCKRSTRVRQRTKLWHFPRVTQRDRDSIVGMAGRYESGDYHLALDWFRMNILPRHCELHQIACLDTQPFRKSTTHECGVV